MYTTKEIGRYNVEICGEQLTTTENRWYFILRIDKFDEQNYNKWEEGNHFYIQGYTDGNVEEQFKYHGYVNDWLRHLTEREVDRIFSFRKNHIFKIQPPIPPKVIEVRPAVRAMLV